MDEVLGMDELALLLKEVQEEIEIQIMNHNRRGELNQYLKQLPIKQDQVQSSTTERKGKILVIGDSRVRQRHLRGIVSTLSLDPTRFDFVTNYEEIKNYPFEKLAYNTRYDYILAGPMPHMVRGVGEDSSIISKIEQNSDTYPPLARIMTEVGELKISKSSFKKVLEEQLL